MSSCDRRPKRRVSTSKKPRPRYGEDVNIGDEERDLVVGISMHMTRWSSMFCVCVSLFSCAGVFVANVMAAQLRIVAPSLFSLAIEIVCLLFSTDAR